jgi:hypothetical protein
MMKPIKKAAVLAAAALFSSGCSDTGPGPLRVTMSIDKQAVAMDDSLRVTMRVTNISAEPVMVYPPTAYGPCAFAGFELFDRDWRRGYEGYICAAALIAFLPDPVPLLSGESLEITRVWRPARTFIEGQPLTPGLYRIRGAAVTVDRTLVTPVREIIVGD